MLLLSLTGSTIAFLGLAFAVVVRTEQSSNLIPLIILDYSFRNAVSPPKFL